MKSTWFMLPLAAASSFAVADEPLSKDEIAAKLSGVTADDITESPVEGLYQISRDSTVAYVTADGRFLIQGEVYDLENLENLTESSRASARVDMLASVDPGQAIVFAPANGEIKHSITIFTDIDCGYCRQFHRDIAEVNALGVEVRYMFYPRTGPDTESWEKADRVWCAEDRNSALTRAKLGGAVPENDCGSTPVAAHYELGQRVGVRGTPSVFAADGTLLGGYLPPDTLLEQLELLAE